MKAGFSSMRLRSKLQLNPNSWWLELDKTLDATPGQFVMVWLPGVGEKPFSIAGMDPFCLLVVTVGPFSTALSQLEPGNPIWVKGPLGKGFTLGGQHQVLVGGGYGSAPLLPLAASAVDRGNEVRVCLGASTAEDLLLENEFVNMGCNLSVTTEDGSRGVEGLVTKVVEEIIQAKLVDFLYACGPAGMLSAIADLCRVNRINYQVSWEAQMRCGMGLCGSCEVPMMMDPSLPPGWLACFDGPVFRKTWDEG